jgi:hypothetical protein
MADRGKQHYTRLAEHWSFLAYWIARIRVSNGDRAEVVINRPAR